jgi:hypothetical protein
MQGRNKRGRRKKTGVDTAMFGVVMAAAAMDMRRFRTSCMAGFEDSNLQRYDAFRATLDCRRLV